MPERPSSAGARAGVGNCQGVETPRPLVSAQKGVRKTKKTEYTKRRGGTGAGEEEAWWRRKGCQEMETQLPPGPAGTRPQVEAGRGEEWFKEWRKKDGT